MDADYGGVLIVPTIVGLVEVGKRLGLPTGYAVPVAVGLGLAITLGYALVAGLPGGRELADAGLRGVALGLSAAGLYSAVKHRSPGDAQELNGSAVGQPRRARVDGERPAGSR